MNLPLKSSLFSLLTFSVMALALAGCRLQSHLDPNQPVILDPLTLPSDDTPSAAPLPPQWWTSFNNPALNQLVQQALRDNFSIRAAWDRLNQARQLAVESGAPLWPSINYNAGYTRSRQEISSRRIDSDQFSAGLAAAYEFDFWGQIRNQRQAALLDVQATEQNLVTAAITLSAAITRVGYQLTESQALLDLLDEQIDTNRKILDLVINHAQHGQSTSADVYRQKQLVENTRGQKIQIQRQNQLLRHQLAILLGQSPAEFQLSTKLSPLPDADQLPPFTISSHALTHRPDIRAAWLKINAADLRVAAAIADRFPSLTLSASVNTTSQHAANLFDDWLENLIVNLTGPLFDANRRQAEVLRTQAVLSQTINDYRQTVLNAIKEIQDAQTNENSQRRYLDSLHLQLRLAQQTYNRTREQYLGGQLGYIRVLESQQSLQNLQRTVISARRQLIDYRIDLCRAAASGWLPEPPRPADTSVFTHP